MLHFNQALGRGVKKLQSPKLHELYVTLSQIINSHEIQIKGMEL